MHDPAILPAPAAIRFFHRGAVVRLDEVPPTRSVLDWLREDAHRTGTKEGCNEGDCGACTVVLAELEGDRVRFRAVNSCIQFLPTIDGKELITVESLKGADGALHPVQRHRLPASSSASCARPGRVPAARWFS